MHSIEELREILDPFVADINTGDFAQNDPIQFPKRFSKLQDIEIAGFLVATISWGKRSMILRDAERMLELMGNSPYEYIMTGEFPDGDKFTIHRTFNTEDFTFICNGLKALYSKYDSMESLFVNKDSFEGIEELRNTIIGANSDPNHRGKKHVSSPTSGSACKRICMFLRWMVRNDGIVDIGCWKNISPATLYIPLDVHVGNIARKLGITARRQNDKKAVIEITNKLRELDREDPIKYDFALFGVGEANLL